MYRQGWWFQPQSISSHICVIFVTRLPGEIYFLRYLLLKSQRKSRFICRVGVIIKQFCRLVGRQSELQKKPHTGYKTLSLVNFTVTYPASRGPSIFQDTSFRLTSKDRRASQGSGYLHVMHVINTICARSCEWAATCH